jgi:hypothetical protein
MATTKILAITALVFLVLSSFVGLMMIRGLQQLAYAATYREPYGRFTIGYHDGWTPISSTSNTTSVSFTKTGESKLTHGFNVMILPKTPSGLAFTTIVCSLC